MLSSHGSVESLSLLETSASQVAETIETSSANLYVIVTHYDADGLAAASIMARILVKHDRPFIIRVVDQVDEDTLSLLPKGDYYVFTDLGSSTIDKIINMGFKPASVIDHHEPLRSKPVAERNVHELNPHAFGINGGKEVSASGLAYLVAKSMKCEDHLMAYLAIAGAMGDRQEEGAKGLTGINGSIVQDSLEKGWVKRNIGLRLYGVPRQPLVKSLMYTIDPLLPGLTYDEVACHRFLESIGIPTKKPDGSLTTYKDLSADEVSKLATALIKHMLIKGFSPQVANSLFGCIYEFLYEFEDSSLRYAHDFAQTLNACGRLRKPSVGLAIGLGSRKVLMQAEALSLEYRRRLAQYISLIRNDASYIRTLKNIQVMDLKNVVDERILGALSSITISSYMCNITKPLISIALSSGGKIKVSARMHESLLKRGVNLGFIIKLAAEQVGGSGGGHEVAAGAMIPSQALDKFFKLVDNLVEKALQQGTALERR